MGQAVKRRDPRTGRERDYYKADDGRLYANYQSAVDASEKSKSLLDKFLGKAKAAVSSIQDRGLIPVHTLDRGTYGAAVALKGLMGPLGKPYRIEDNPDARAYRQEQVNAAKPVGRSLEYSSKVPGYKVPAGPREELANLAIGQWWGEKGGDGRVRTKDVWDTNQNADWQRREAVKHLQGGNVTRAGWHGMASVAAGLQDANWTNRHPLGGSIDMGGIAARATPAAASPPAQREAEYVVNSGDTLSAISKQLGVSVSDLAMANKISDINRISVGQRLRRPL